MYYQYLSTHSNQWDGKCHNLWIISMRFNTALDSCSIYDQFIAVHRRSSKVRACYEKNENYQIITYLSSAKVKDLHYTNYVSQKYVF